MLYRTLRMVAAACVSAGGELPGPRSSARCSSRIRRTSSTASGWQWTVVWSAGTISSLRVVFHVGALVAHHPVAARRNLPISPLSGSTPDDVVVLDPGRARAGEHHREDRRTGRERVDAVLDLQQRVLGEHVLVVADTRPPGFAGASCGRLISLAASHCVVWFENAAAAVGSADGDHAADRRVRLEEEALLRAARGPPGRP